MSRRSDLRLQGHIRRHTQAGGYCHQAALVRRKDIHLFRRDTDRFLLLSIQKGAGRFAQQRHRQKAAQGNGEELFIAVNENHAHRAGILGIFFFLHKGDLTPLDNRQLAGYIQACIIRFSTGTGNHDICIVPCQHLIPL